MNPDQDSLAEWMRTTRGWQPLAHQTTLWAAAESGESGLLIAPTGHGKSLAALGSVLRADIPAAAPGPLLLWITPLRALAADLAGELAQPLATLRPAWRVECRTGDTTAAVRARQRKALPQILLTTPESVSLLLSYPDTLTQLSRLRAVIVDEWHELLGNKRGVQTQLVLAALRRQAPGLVTWGLSATVGNPEQACAALVPDCGQIIRAPQRKAIDVVSLLPKDPGHITWAGHLGLNMLPQVMDALAAAHTTLLFTNTRAQAELWFEAITAKPGWAKGVALHHGSLDARERLLAEQGLKHGHLRCVVATSSLDLGVDFSPVDQVIQIGSPRTVARLVQRAGRAGHAPGQPSRILCVPSHTLELAEFAAARAAVQAGRVEPRIPAQGGLDVLAQHVLTRCLGQPQNAEALQAEIRTAAAYADLPDAHWEWVLDFLGRGGEVLRAYPEYGRLAMDGKGRLTVANATVARRHRLQIGTIAADAVVRLRWVRGGGVGHVEESFIARLKPGDAFLFAGRALELVRVDGLTAQVRAARGKRVAVPRWSGGRLPLSEPLVGAFLELLHRASGPSVEPADMADTADAANATSGERRGGVVPEQAALRALLARQRAESALPSAHYLLVETTRSREGWHLCLYPCAGRAVHEGLGALVAWQASQQGPRSITVAANDYGVELLSTSPWPVDESWLRALLVPADPAQVLDQAINGVELARRHFREIAQAAGLVFTGYPGRGKNARQVQMSTGLLFDVYCRYDPNNPLLAQTRREVLERELDAPRLYATLTRLRTLPIRWHTTARLTPFAFPLFAESQRQQLSSEALHDRLRRYQQQWGGGNPAVPVSVTA